MLKQTQVIFAVAAIAIVVLIYSSGRAPLPASLPPGAPDLTGVFAAHEDHVVAAEDAAQTAAMLDALADMIEGDVRSSKVKLTKDTHVEDLRVAVREWQLAGQHLSQRYPEIGKAMGDHLAKHVPGAAGEVTPERRAEWVVAFRTLAASCRHASENL